MKRLFAFILFTIFCCPNVLGQQNIRVSYAFLHKDNVADENWRTDMDLLLDVNMRESVFYSEASYLRDSLALLAFDDAGNTKDREQVSKIRSLNNAAFKNVWHIDYSSCKYDIYNKILHHAFLGEGGDLEVPDWTFTENESEFNGHKVKKATGKYMGRNWTVWYTEEIPVPSGPWLLWGCPGLIIYAIDEDKMFNFYVLGEEEIERNRWETLKANYVSHNATSQRMTIREEEAIKCRLNRDLEYTMQLMGAATTDNNGNAINTISKRDFEPLIPESYWKKK